MAEQGVITAKNEGAATEAIYSRFKKLPPDVTSGSINAQGILPEGLKMANDYNGL